MGLRDRLSEERSSAPETDLVAVYRERLMEEVDVDDLARLAPGQRRVRLERILSRMLSTDGPVLSARERGTLIQRIVDDALGLGVLEPLLADESITEIMVNGPLDIFVERRGRVEQVGTRFASEEQLLQTIDRIVSQVNRRVDESSPMVDARLPSGERVNVIIPPLALDGPTMTIRRFPSPFQLSELAGRGSIDSYTATLLAACVRAGMNVLISGGTGTGKTTFLNALSGLIPDDERIVTIEDAAELSLQQAHVVRLESRPANAEGRGQVSIRDLVRNALRMRPDRIVVGEVRGGETLDMLQAMNTGHEGSLTTVHANSAIDALARLETLASMSEVELPVSTIRDQINSALDVIIQLERGIDGSRRVVQVAYVTSERREEYKLQPILDFVADPLGPERVVTGRFVPRELPDELVQRLRVAGEPVVAPEPQAPVEQVPG
ncbi:CpaF family protein [Bogoriella caseilytica]|uniref:Pilus assembly protein CpaF n=1 Tax=Bogoriella caseilytica TaxID=56055 RepID=A0A3N2BBR3_9MICO|nr:CpaF family protein [Bogoriella caseilytica]ROR72668.1 pilus assembly protein CpaF [Bogoriella caseilytica]